jgi:hypothetical protein
MTGEEMTKTKKQTKRRKGQSGSKAMLAGTVIAWAWKCDFGLCQWAEPDRERLSSARAPQARSAGTNC